MQQAKSTCKKGNNKKPCTFHIKCYLQYYKCKGNKDVAGEASAFRRCPTCAPSKFRRGTKRTKGIKEGEEDDNEKEEEKKKKQKKA